MCAAITTAAIGVGISGYMAYNSAQEKKKAKRALDNYDRQELKNPYENVQISTEGSDLMREESGRTSANLVEAAQGSGVRGVMGAIPKIQAYTNLENRDAQKYLDDQVQKREYAIAGDETNLRAVKENRDNANISALSSQIDKADQDMWNGISGMATSVAYGANGIQASNANKAASRTPVTALPTPKSADVVPLGTNLTPTVEPLKTPWYFDKKYSGNLELIANNPR